MWVNGKLTSYIEKQGNKMMTGKPTLLLPVCNQVNTIISGLLQTKPVYTDEVIFRGYEQSNLEKSKHETIN